MPSTRTALTVGRLATIAVIVVHAACGGGAETCGTSAPNCGTAGNAPSVVSVAVVGAPATMAMNQSATLTATVAVSNGASQTVTWSSSDQSVATVVANGNSATVTAAGPGTASITATSVADPRRQGAIAITVLAPIPVSAVAIQPAAAYIVTADTLQLSATVTAGSSVVTGREITWTSSASNIATVSSSGAIHPVNPGVATITATVEGKTATAKVSVTLGRGQRVPAMMSYDSVIPAILTRYGVPGAAIAVMRNGKLSLARGYGYADTALKKLVEPTSLFRIASVSKPITSAAIMKLVEAGKLSLDDKAFTILNDVRPLNAANMDRRFLDVTVRHLLTHSGGWDRELSGDPITMTTPAAVAMGATPPADVRTLVRYWMSRPLDFNPGTRYAYSNLGYGVLGLIIEKISGQSYEEFVKSTVLAPAGVTRMRTGRTLLSQRAADEVQYYDPRYGPSVFPPFGQVLYADGAIYIEGMPASGGWIASAPDLLRFSGAVDGFGERPDILSSASIAAMTAKPSFWTGDAWYGFGWLVNTGPHWWHNGVMQGTSSLLVRTGLGVSWAILLNQNYQPANLPDIMGAIDSEMWVAYSRVVSSSWPTHDLFDRY